MLGCCGGGVGRVGLFVDCWRGVGGWRWHMVVVVVVVVLVVVSVVSVVSVVRVLWWEKITWELSLFKGRLGYQGLVQVSRSFVAVS